MPKGNAIAAAVLASAGNSGGSSNGSNTAGGLSPLIASYSQQYSADVPYSPLPRQPATFLNGAFGPFNPITAMPIDPPREDTGRPNIRRFQYNVGYNLPTGVVGDDGYKLAPFATLRSLADTYSVARACVDKRKQEIIALDWDIVPTDEAEQALMGDESARADWEKRRAVVKKFFEHPDSDRSKYPTFGTWLSALLEDRFVIDAVAIHLVPPRKKGAGPFGSDLASLDLIDGSTARPLLNTLGATPAPPNPAVQIYEWGVPRADAVSVITDADIEELPEPVAEYRADQMIYMRETPRANTPYGLSLVERALLPISIGLARQQYQNLYFQDGSVPAQWVTPGPDISTPQQIRQLQDALNSLAGDIGAKHRIIVLPPGSKADPQKPFPLADQFDEWIISQVAMPFGLTPMDLGVTPRVSAVQTPSESRELSQINTDKGSQTRIEPVCADLKAVVFDYVIQHVFKQKDMQFSWGLTDRGKNRQLLIDQGVELVKVGGKTLDELRIDLGDTPYGLPESSVPLVYTATGAVPLQAAAPETALPPGQSAAGGAPAQQGQQQGRMPTDDELTTPAHEAARALPSAPKGGARAAEQRTAQETAAKQAAELEILGRYLRKGRDLARFEPQSLPAESIEAAARMLPQGVPAAVKAARDAADAKRRQDRRDRHLEAAAAVVASRLGQLVRDHKNAGLSLPHVVDGGVAVMADGYRHAMSAGSQDASDDYEDTPVADGAQVDSDAQDAAQEQRGYLTGLLQDVIGGLSTAAIGARLALYAATLYRAYNASYGDTVMTAHPTYEIIWELGDAKDHCRLCVDRDGKSFTVDSLPGWPGDKGFGGEGALCVTGDTLISAPLIEVAFRRRYEGPVVQLTTASGRTLACTPNHPVLTDQGWVRADFLKVGDHVVGARLVEGTGLGDPHVQDGPSRIDEIFAALSASSLGKRMAAGGLDLDIEDFADCDVEIVRPNRELLFDVDSAIANQVGQSHLVRADGSAVLVPERSHGGLPSSDVTCFSNRADADPARSPRTAGDGVSSALLPASGSTAAALGSGFAVRQPGSARLGMSLIGGQLAHVQANPLTRCAQYAESFDSVLDDVSTDTERLGDLVDRLPGGVASFELGESSRADLFRQRWIDARYRRSLAVTNLDASGQQPLSDERPADLEILRELELGGSADVALDEVVDIQVVPYSGHVYNLRTSSAFYIANGVVTHNCEGGPRCRCSIRFVQNGKTVSVGTNTQLDWSGQYYDQQNREITAARRQAAAERQDFVDSLPDGPAIRAATRDDLRRQVADLANQRIRQSGGYPGVSVEPQDIPASIIAQMLPPGMEGAAGLSEPRIDVAQAVQEMFAAKSTSALSGPAADAQTVYDQLAVNYRPEGIAWVLDMPWMGPVEVPLGRIDWDHLDAWAAAHDDAHVADFEQRIRSGGSDVKPVVAVTVPGDPLAKVIDGHHRALAYKRLRQPVKAWVGRADTDRATAPFFMTHAYQLHSGGDPLNKRAKVSKASVRYRAAEDLKRSCGTCVMFHPDGTCDLVAGWIEADDTCDRWEPRGGDTAKSGGPGDDPSRVAFLLLRAPNGDGKLRYLLQKRNDETWGLPGGKSLAGESTWDAAVREAREELGGLPAVKPAAVWSRAEDDHVVWTYLVDLPEMFAPAGNGDGETAGYGWFKRKDVTGLPLHPAMRRTWARLDFDDDLLGGNVPDVAKAARGYELNPRSGMISLDLPDGLIEPVPGGVADFHITAVYLGPDVADDAFAIACERAAQAAAAAPGPLSGVVSGRGTFEPSDSSDGKTVVWAGVTLPGVEQIRAALADLSASSFTQWSPHVTRAYIDADDDLPDPLPATPVTFTHLSVHRGDNEVVRYPLGGGR